MDSSQAKEIDGKKIAEDILRDVGVVAKVMQKRVCFIQFGDDVPSTQFIARKVRIAAQMGIQADVLHERTITTTDAALALVSDSVREDYDGIVVQLPLPYSIDADTVLNAIPPELDIDVLSAEGLRAFERGQTERMPPVAGAVDAIIRARAIELEGKAIVIVGKGKLVGAPIALLFDKLGISYTAIDIGTLEHEQHELFLAADIIISGIGVAGHIQPHMIKEGVVLIDAGTSEHAGVLVGDIDPSCHEKASLYTPVPGGVGPVTVAVLLRNIFL